MNSITSECNWKVVRLEEAATIRYGLGQPPELDNDGVPMIRATDIKNGRIISQSVMRVKQSALPQKRDPFLRNGDIIVVRSGAYTGDVAIYDGRWEVAIAGYDLVVSTDGQYFDPKFVAYCLMGNAVQRYFKTKRDRSAQPHINAEQLGKTELPLPPMSEQRAIAATLRAVQDAREARRREQALEQERKAELMEDLFTCGLRREPLKETEIGPKPQSWRCSTLGELGTISSGGTPGRGKPEYWGGTIPWIKTGEIIYNVIYSADETITELGLQNSSAKIVPAGTLLMAMYGQGITRGKVAILGIDAAINQACAAILLSDAIEVRFAFYFLSHLYHEIRNLGHGAQQKNLNAALVKSIPMVVPQKEEQRDIAEILTACDHKIAALETESTLHDELFRALLEELMTGRISTAEIANERSIGG